MGGASRRENNHGFGSNGLGCRPRANQVSMMNRIKRAAETDFFPHQTSPWCMYWQVRIAVLPKADEQTLIGAGRR
jgi:hypothetical protein